MLPDIEQYRRIRYAQAGGQTAKREHLFGASGGKFESGLSSVVSMQLRRQAQAFIDSGFIRQLCELR